MIRTTRRAANGKSTPEAKFELVFPVLDVDSHRQAIEDTVTNCTVEISVHIEYSAEVPVEANRANKKPGGVEQDNKTCGSDHVHPSKLCALMGCKKGKMKGCKECCGTQTHQPQSAKSVENGIDLLSKKIHEATLESDWHSVEVSKFDRCTDEDMDATNAHQEQLSMCGDENFELVDGVVETHLVGGQLIQEWKDTMQMVDGGSQGSSKALKELWLGD